MPFAVCISMSFLVCCLVFLWTEREKLSPPSCARKHLSPLYILSFDCTIGLGLDLFASSVGE